MCHYFFRVLHLYYKSIIKKYVSQDIVSLDCNLAYNKKKTISFVSGIQNVDGQVESFCL